MNSEPGIAERPDLEASLAEEIDDKRLRERTIARMRLLWEQRRFLLRMAGAGLLAATLLAFLLPKRYQSITRLMPPDAQAGSGLAMTAALAGQAGGLGAVAGGLLGLKSSGALFIGILRSRSVQDGLIQRFGLKKVYGCALDESARARLSENTDIAEDRKSGIISITVTDRDPRRAAALAAGYVSELDSLVIQLNTSSAHRERVFLEDRLKTAKADLESAEKDFSQFASKSGTVDINEQGRAMVDAGATLLGQFMAAESELQGLKQIYTDENVRVRATKARVAELERQLQKFSGQETAGATAADPAPESSSYPTLRKLPLLGVTYADLYRRMKIQEVVYETLTQQYELAKVQEAKETPSVKVLDPANVPERESFPPRLLIMSVGTCLVIALSSGWVLASACWRKTDPQDPAKVFVEEVLRTLKAELPGMGQNGAGLRSRASGVWHRWRRHDGESEKPG